jgi:hypothetical protein
MDLMKIFTLFVLKKTLTIGLKPVWQQHTHGSLYLAITEKAKPGSSI